MALKSSFLSPFKDGKVGDDEGKIHPKFQKWLDLLVKFVNRRQEVIDLTNFTSDYKLKVGECAKVTISAASTLLNIAVEDGLYEIDIIFDVSTFNADQIIALDPNNDTYATEFTRIRFAADDALATDEVDTIESAPANHIFSAASRPKRVCASLNISGMISDMLIQLNGIESASRRLEITGSTWTGSVAHTSLGTLQIGEAASGTAYFRRLA